LSGAKVDGASKPAELFPESLIWAIVSVFVVGLGIIIGLMAMMKELLNLNVGIILAAASLIFMLLVAIEGVLIWQLISHRRGAKDAGDTGRLKELATKELDAAQARSLPEPLPSVTEHTTRSFEPVYSERNSK
jgi:hypothetical protein